MNILTVLLAIFVAFGEYKTSALEESKCDSKNVFETEVICPHEDWILTGMAAKSKFFVDAVSSYCGDMKEQVFSDEEEVYSFNYDDGMSFTAKCPHEHHLIKKFTLYVKEDHVITITLHCRLIKDPERIEEFFNVTSNEMDNFVDCGNNGVVQQIHLTNSGDSTITKVVFSCLKLNE